MKVVLVEPGSVPHPAEIGDTLEDMQNVVGGLIQAVYPFEGPVALVCYEEGKLLGLPLNRFLLDEDGLVYDVIAGTFFLCAAPPDSEKRNYNNHPFPGKAGALPFALAHNGVLFNDRELRRSHKLPHTIIETDSYVAVQLIEQKRELSFRRLKQMAEALQGSFTITVLDGENNLYFVKGNNPLTICQFPKYGFYLYTSTAEILNRALTALGMNGAMRIEIKIDQGDIMKIDCDGKRSVARFDDINLCLRNYYGCGGFTDWCSPVSSKKSYEEDGYLEEVVHYGLSRGVPESDLHLLIDAGCDAFDIEEMLFDPALRQSCIQEIVCGFSMC